MPTGDYTLIYPTENVPLVELTRAALAVVGSAYVTVASGAGSQALRIPVDAAERVYDFAGLDSDGNDLPAPPSAQSEPDAPAPPSGKTASGADQESPGPDAPKVTATEAAATAAPARPPARPAGRPGSRQARKATAKKTTRSTGAQKKEGDDQ